MSFSVSSMMAASLGLGADLIGDAAPLRAVGLGRLQRKGGGNEGGDDAPSTLASMGQNIAHEVDAAAPPGCAQHLCDGGLDAFVRIGDDELQRPKPTEDSR
jgi:hypothetical protein